MVWNSQNIMFIVLQRAHMSIRPIHVAHFASKTWWRHPMETFSVLLAFCAGSSPVTEEFPAQWPLTQSFGTFFDLYLNQRLSEQWGRRWFETPLRSLWRHCNEMLYRWGVLTMSHYYQCLFVCICCIGASVIDVLLHVFFHIRLFYIKCFFRERQKWAWTVETAERERVSWLRRPVSWTDSLLQSDKAGSLANTSDSKNGCWKNGVHFSMNGTFVFSVVCAIHQGTVSIRNTVLPGMAIPMLKIRRPNGRLIFNM